jgi:translation initiation factor IF-1
VANANQIRARGTVVEVLQRDAYRIELANGHRAIVRPGRKETASWVTGDSVEVEFHPYDLSRGRIVG